MLGITLQVDDKDQYLDLIISPILVKDKVEANIILDLVQKSVYKHFFIFDENIIEAVNNCKSVTEDNISDVIKYRIGERIA